MYYVSALNYNPDQPPAHFVVEIKYNTGWEKIGEWSHRWSTHPWYDFTRRYPSMKLRLRKDGRIVARR